MHVHVYYWLWSSVYIVHNIIIHYMHRQNIFHYPHVHMYTYNNFINYKLPWPAIYMANTGKMPIHAYVSVVPL